MTEHNINLDVEPAPSAAFMIAEPSFDPDDEITQPYERLVVDERTDRWFRSQLR